MTSKELKKLKKDLEGVRGAKFALSVDLGVDPSKITKALSGLVRDEKFMARFEAKATNILRKEAVKNGAKTTPAVQLDKISENI